MTPPEHFLIGTAGANIAFGLSALFKKTPLSYPGLLLMVGMAAVIPDIDSFFGHYGSTDPMLGHRGATHSFVGVAVLAIPVIFLYILFSFLYRLALGYWLFLYHSIRSRQTGIPSAFRLMPFTFHALYPRQLVLLWLCAFLGGVTHILADMPTPGSVWNGLPVFWPFKQAGEYKRYGGWALIGWYDLKVFWNTLIVVAASIPVVYVGQMIKWIGYRWIAAPFFTLAVILNTYLYYWTVNHIRRSTYLNENDWYVRQMAMVKKEGHPLIQKATEEGVKLFVSVYQQARSGAM